MFQRDACDPGCNLQCLTWLGRGAALGPALLVLGAGLPGADPSLGLGVLVVAVAAAQPGKTSSPA